MNCFNHPEKPAIGVCKSCYKGLCAECVAPLPNGLACRDTCEARVTLMNQMIDNNQKVLAAAGLLAAPIEHEVSGAFLTPIGTTTNLMVMTPGGYNFNDYIKVGLPLMILFLITSLFLIPIISPF